MDRGRQRSIIVNNQELFLFAFLFAVCGRDNFPSDAAWGEAACIAVSAMLSCPTSLCERWKIVAFDFVCGLFVIV